MSTHGRAEPPFNPQRFVDTKPDEISGGWSVFTEKRSVFLKIAFES